LLRADSLNLGVVSFDNLIPGDLGPGVNAFDISNFTGSFGLPPDFPSLTDVTFKNSTLKLFGGTTQILALGDIGPGFLAPAASFPDTDDFSSAEFTADLDVTTFLLAGGGTFTANSAAIDIFLNPSSGLNLLAGDFALITVSNEPTAIPEPASWPLLGLATISLWVFQRVQYGVRRSRG
jgi:hypothetical protein